VLGADQRCECLALFCHDNRKVRYCYRVNDLQRNVRNKARFVILEETCLVDVSRKYDLQCKSLKCGAQPANCGGTGRLHVIAFDAQSLVLASEELREQFSGGIKLAS